MSDELIARINEWKELLHRREYSARANGAFDVAKNLRQQQADLALFAALAKREAVAEGFAPVPVNPSDALVRDFMARAGGGKWPTETGRHVWAAVLAASQQAKEE